MLKLSSKLPSKSDKSGRKGPSKLLQRGCSADVAVMEQKCNNTLHFPSSSSSHFPSSSSSSLSSSSSSSPTPLPSSSSPAFFLSVLVPKVTNTCCKCNKVFKESEREYKAAVYLHKDIPY